jgi:hypothetical protein
LLPKEHRPLMIDCSKAYTEKQGPSELPIECFLHYIR